MLHRRALVAAAGRAPGQQSTASARRSLLPPGSCGGGDYPAPLSPFSSSAQLVGADVGEEEAGAMVAMMAFPPMQMGEIMLEEVS